MNMRNKDISESDIDDVISAVAEMAEDCKADEDDTEHYNLLMILNLLRQNRELRKVSSQMRHDLKMIIQEKAGPRAVYILDYDVQEVLDMSRKRIRPIEKRKSI